MKRGDLLGIVLVFVIGLLAGQGLFHVSGARRADAVTAAPVPEGLTPEEKRDIEVFRRAEPSVAFITSVALRRDLFSVDVQQIPQGTGSGFVWDRQGHIVTNFHVIQDGNAFAVTLADQSDWRRRSSASLPRRTSRSSGSRRRSRSSCRSRRARRARSSSASASSPWATPSGSTTRSPSAS